LGDQVYPVIYRDYIAWEDNRYGDWDIFFYILSMKRESQITTDSTDQQSPAIYENIIVWEDSRNSNRDIYGYNRSTQEMSQITTDSTDQQSPAIYENIIVWEDSRNSNRDIYGYNRSVGEEFPIVVSRGNQLYPAIHKNIIVWQDDRHGNWDIYGYDISTGCQISIATHEGDQIYPAIFDDYIVWQDDRHGNWDIYGCKLHHEDSSGRYVLTSQEVQITTDEYDQISPAIYEDIVVWIDRKAWQLCGYNLSKEQKIELKTRTVGNQRSPAIYEDIVVWEDNENFDWDIYWIDRSTGTGFLISKDKDDNPASGDQVCPAIYNDYVIWADKRHGNWDIYGYNLSTGKEILITTHEADQSDPTIYNDYVIWADKRHGNWDIYGYDLSTGKEMLITTHEGNQRFPAIYETVVVWVDDRNHRLDIYGYDIHTEEEVPILESSKKLKESSLLGYAGILLMIAIIAFFCVYKKYPNLFKQEYAISSEEVEPHIYEVDVLKDPLSRVVLRRWRSYFAVLLFFLFLHVLTSLHLGTLGEIDIDSLPREKVVLLKEEIFALPMLREPIFVLYCVTATIIFFLAREFFRYIPHAFENLFEDKIIKKKKGSSAEKVLADFNTSLQEFERQINEKYVYVPAFFICTLGIITQSRRTPLGELSFVSWSNPDFFPVNSLVFVVMALSMFFVLGILMWKMFCVVSFMRKLSNDYDLVLKPYDTDELGGFKPLEQLWLKMSYMAIPVLVVLIILSALSQVSGITFYPLGRFSDLILCNIVIVGLIVYPIWNYRRIVETQKAYLIEHVQKKIEKSYKSIEEALSEEKDLESTSMGQIKQFQEVERRVKSIPSLPFTRYQKAYIFLSAIIPWIAQVMSYGQSFLSAVISWIT
jgi:beta propeller repeat protein